jgi:hypothetical protein
MEHPDPAPKLSQKLYDIREEGPQNNWNLNVARELEIVARCAPRCRVSTIL